ncbi:MAG: helix-turn-helix domain-containing protein [Acidobacteriaceae bacterium]|nr:helix-turn-helix domain-containing protein [Acidobacteriaceae bacterium]
METKLPPLERLLTPRDVAHWLGVSVDWVQDHATSKEPRLPCLRLGKLLRFRRDEVAAFIAERSQAKAHAFTRDLRLANRRHR